MINEQKLHTKVGERDKVAEKGRKSQLSGFLVFHFSTKTDKE